METPAAKRGAPIGVQVERTSWRCLNGITHVVAETFKFTGREENEIAHEWRRYLASQEGGSVEILLIDVIKLIHGALS